MSDQSSRRNEDLIQSQSLVQDVRPPITWIYIPFEAENSEDQQRWAKQLQEEHQQRGKKGRKHDIINYDWNKKGQLSEVRPGDTVLVLGHGTDHYPESLEIHSSLKRDGSEDISAKKLAIRLLKAGLNPQGVGIKIGSCYSGGAKNPEKPQNALNEKLFAYAFALEFAKQVVEDGLSQPEFVDGYIGDNEAAYGLSTPDPDTRSGKRTHNRGRLQVIDALVETKFGDRLQQIEDLKKTGAKEGSEVSQQIEKLQEQLVKDAQEYMQTLTEFRLSDNRVRFRIGGDPNSPQVRVDEEDLERAKHNRSVSPSQRRKLPRFNTQSQPKPLVQDAQPIQVDDQHITVTNVNLPQELFISLDQGGKPLGKKDQSQGGTDIDIN